MCANQTCERKPAQRAGMHDVCRLAPGLKECIPDVRVCVMCRLQAWRHFACDSFLAPTQVNHAQHEQRSKDVPCHAGMHVACTLRDGSEEQPSECACVCFVCTCVCEEVAKATARFYMVYCMPRARVPMHAGTSPACQPCKPSRSEGRVPCCSPLARHGVCIYECSGLPTSGLGTFLPWDLLG